MFVLWLLEVWLLPNSAGDVPLNAGAIAIGSGSVPAASKPATHTAESIACGILLSTINGIQPSLVAFITGSPDGIPYVGIISG
jgi:hypothetical protein